MMFLRSLLPSWKFFEDIGDTPILFFKTKDDGTNEPEGWGEWQSFHQDIKRQFWHLFFNPGLNLQLAEKSALQHALADLMETDQSHPASLEIIRKLVERKIDDDLSFQYKISIYNGGELEDVFFSGELNKAQS